MPRDSTSRRDFQHHQHTSRFHCPWGAFDPDSPFCITLGNGTKSLLQSDPPSPTWDLLPSYLRGPYGTSPLNHERAGLSEGGDGRKDDSGDNDVQHIFHDVTTSSCIIIGDVLEMSNDDDDDGGDGADGGGKSEDDDDGDLNSA